MKKLALVIGLLLLLVSIPVAVFVTRQQTEIRSKAAPSTSLTFSPATATKAVGESFDVQAVVETGGNQIISADLVISFDPNVVDIMDVRAGPFLPGVQEIQKNVNSSTGTVTYSIYTTKANATTGQGTIAILSVQGKAAGTASLQFNTAATSLYGLSENQNVWTKNPATASFTITEGGGQEESPAPTPTPTPTPEQSDNPADTPTYDFAITAPQNGAVISQSQPTIEGTAEPESVVTVVVSGPSIHTLVAQTGSGGRWSTRPETALPDGTYTVSASEQASDGSTRTASSSFTVKTSSSSSPSSPPVVNPPPVSATTSYTWMAIVAGIALVAAGSLFAL